VLLLSLFGGVLAATAVPSSAGAATASCAPRAVPAGILGAVAARAPSGCATATGHADMAGAGAAQPGYDGGNPPLLYGGGPVVGTPSTPGENTVHALFWAPAGYTFPAGYEAGIDTYLDDVAAASGSASNVYAVGTQYTDGQASGAPHLHYDVHVGAPVDATDPYPTTGGCTPDSDYSEGYTACVTDAQMHTEINSVLTADDLPGGMADVYLVIFPPGVETCAESQDAAAGGTCSDTDYPGFCAYHSALQGSSSVDLYANIPFPTAFYYGCVTDQSPNGSAALDSALSMISHEHNETITDPLGNAWIDSAGNEEADECAWNFGTPLGGAPGAEYNQVINGDDYYLQQEFSNEDFALDPSAGCARAQDVPTASITVTTAHPASGIPTAFDGSASAVANVPGGITTWSWDFGDSTGTVTGTSPSHVYASAGTYTVTLTVTDSDGFTGEATRSVTVAAARAPSFTAASPPATATVGKSYRYAFTTTGAPPATYALSGAPRWLSVGATTGVVTGTPPAGTTSFSYSVTATNGVAPGATAGPFSVSVNTATGSQGTAHGYWLVGADGGIFSFGSAGFYGSTGNIVLQRAVVGITPTADRRGYWLVGSDGGIFAFGDAGYYGSLPGLGFAPAGTRGGQPALAAPIVGMVPSADDGGYFMVAADGGVFAFGDARFAGSCPGIGGCGGQAVSVMPDATGDGYWLVTATGNVYAFGDAPYFGAAPSGGSPVTSAVRTPDGRGYWILTAAGNVYGFGDAADLGQPAGSLGSDTATAVFSTADGAGYWVATAAGAVDNYGDAPADGSMAGTPLNAPIIAATGW
jgi:PKD repeat protein